MSIIPARVLKRNGGKRYYSEDMGSHPSRRGFTLIELLVVIAIIALAFGFLVSQFQGVIERSRDDRRLSDMTQLRHALSLYATDRGRYPMASQPIAITGSDPVSTELLYESAINAIPTDPLTPDFEYTYQSNAIGTTYTLSFCLETDSVKSYTKGCNNKVSP